MGSRALVCSGLGSGLERVFWGVLLLLCFCRFGLAGLGWAGLPLGLAGLGPEFWGVLPGFGGFCFCFCNLIFGSGGGLVFGWAGLGGFSFCFGI